MSGVNVSEKKIIESQVEMTESEAIQTIVTQAAIQAGTAAVMAIREADAGPISGAYTATTGEANRQRCGGPGLKQSFFNWNALNKYVQLLHFKMEVVKILQMKTCEIT